MRTQENKEKYKEYYHKYYIKYKRPKTKIGQAEAEIDQLKQQLEEKDKENEELKQEINKWVGHKFVELQYQKAIQELEKVKDFVDDIQTDLGNDYMIDRFSVLKQIDQQIKELKGGTATMKAILISIKPEWVEKILNGEKTIEVRKTKPNCELPIKVYIYCTKGKNTIVYIERKGEEDWWGNTAKQTILSTKPKYDYLNYFCETLGKVVAEFTLNEIETINEHEYYNAVALKNFACLTPKELNTYTKGKKFYAWHIDNLKIYDDPKELSEFGVKKPFQSWGYVEDKCQKV